MKLKEILKKLNQEVLVDIVDEGCYNGSESYYYGNAVDVPANLLNHSFAGLETKFYVNYKTKNDDLVFVIYVSK